MRILLRIKWSVSGLCLKVERRAWGISHDEQGNWTIGKLQDPKEAEFKYAKKMFDKWGITIATSGVTEPEPGAVQ